MGHMILLDGFKVISGDQGKVGHCDLHRNFSYVTYMKFTGISGISGSLLNWVNMTYFNQFSYNMSSVQPWGAGCVAYIPGPQRNPNSL